MLSLIAKNSQISATELAEKLQVSRNSINTMISKLKKEGWLARIGGIGINGHWKVLKTGD
ncbi:MAG: winged helix-turn-helix transcriptional regulator [Oligoflexia bacterium]|nr:winged helix-turn-helix transcriptional regulator [Oligoflexia bacterium]